MVCLLGAAALAAQACGSGPSPDPVPLTSGPGNDTEAAWSPDGRSIVFQSDRNGSLDLFVLDVASRSVRALVEGPGEACFPAWSPDGNWVAFSQAHFTRTALEGQPDGYNLFLVPASGGAPRRLTRGLYRDTSPEFLADGKTIWFSSDRPAGEEDKSEGTEKSKSRSRNSSNAVSLFALSTDAGEPSLVLPRHGQDRAAIQASLSPDGQTFACGVIAGFQDNWRIRLAHAARPEDGYLLTGGPGCFYGPRWEPAGSLLACTGFQVGDPGWSVWLLDPRSGHRRRVETGPGNSRSPAWSPNGRELVFENNRTGSYKLYRLPAPALPPAPVAAAARPREDGLVLHLSFAECPAPGAVMDGGPFHNTGQMMSKPAWREHAVSFTPPGSSLAIPAPRGFDFGRGPFAVQVVVEPSAKAKFAMIAMGQYPGNRLGWQLYVADDGRAWFNSRTAALVYRGARSDEPLPLGRPVTLTGVRDAAGRVRLYVDGALQQMASADADYEYGNPVQVRIGAQHDGSAPWTGWLHEVAVHARELTPEEIAGNSLARFWAARPGKAGR